MHIQEHVDLLPFNTFHIKASARRYTTISNTEELQTLVRHNVFRSERVLVLGGGSNILFTGNFDGLVVKIDIRGVDIVQQTNNTITLKVGAGEQWHAFVMHCVQNGWGGVENLSLIPGTMGAAPMQNIGAYGVEIEEVINSVDAVDRATGMLVTFQHSDCKFGYRESIFKQEAKDKYIISSVTLTLTLRDHQYRTGYGAIQEKLREHGAVTPSIKAISDAVIAIRQSKLPDPNVVGNAGSFFKNPTISHQKHSFLKAMHPAIPSFPVDNTHVKIPAAWLIEQCGWKGKRFDHIGVHTQQPLVLVNYGDGDGKKIWSLAMDIRASVKEKFDIELQPEVNVIT